MFEKYNLDRVLILGYLNVLHHHEKHNLCISVYPHGMKFISELLLPFFFIIYLDMINIHRPPILKYLLTTSHNKDIPAKDVVTTYDLEKILKGIQGN